MPRVYNFAAGPAMLPEAVLVQARDELLDWHQLGTSVMEVSHRGKDFGKIAEESEQDLRDLLKIPDNYHVLFLQGGSQTQFAAIPMNILGDHKKAVYVDTGIWSDKAIEQAKKYCDVHVVASAKSSDYKSIPDSKTWDIPKDAAYLYYVDNETVNGLEFPTIPESDLPLVCDMSSNILSRPVDVSRFDLIFACAQKNLGPAGITVVIVRDDLLKRQAMQHTPNTINYAIQAKAKSMLNTPPTFPWYMTGLVLKWVKKEGGVEAMAERDAKKSKALYEFIDQSNFYNNAIDPQYRSRLNVVFTLGDEKLNDTFLKESSEAGLANLKGHRLLGGMRASIYNAMPEAGVDALITFMREFEQRR